MCGYWIGFIVYLLLIIGGIYALKLPKLLGIRYLIFSLFIDSFYISIPYQNIACQFIFGGLTLLTIFVNLSVNFVQSDKNKLIKRFELVFDFVLGIVLSIYLIYIIPNEDLQNIVIPIVSAVYGGLLTLVGVAWTIKKSDSDRKREEQQKAIPVFTYNQVFNSPNIKEKIKTCFPISLEENYFSDIYLEIENSEVSHFELMKIYHDKKWFGLENNTLVLPKGKVVLSFRFNNPLDIFLVVKDRLMNLYYYTIEVVSLHHTDEQNAHEVYTIRSLKPITKEYIDNIEKEHKGEKHE